MKKYLLSAIILFLWSANGWTQNLVSNPSFEEYNNCPARAAMGQGGYGGQEGIAFSPTYTGFPSVKGWVTPLETTPDYFNACSTPRFLYPVTVPGNFAGYQNPRTGNAYAGFFTGEFTAVGGGETFKVGRPSVPGSQPFFGHTWSNFGEYLETKLVQPMQAGHRYKVHFFISLSNYISYDTFRNSFAMDQLGAHFSERMIVNGNAAHLKVTPQVSSPPGVFISDTSNWVKVAGIYTALGGEQWLTLGRFFDKDSFSIQRLATMDTLYNPNTINWVYELNTNLCYYYIDDVCVVDMDQPITSRVDTLLCPSSFPMSLHGRADGDTFLWNTGATTATISTNDSGIYWVSSIGECGYYVDTFYLNVPPKPYLGRDTNHCPKGAAVLSVQGKYPSYSWSTGDTTAYIVVTKPGDYVLTVTDRCGAQQKDTIKVSFDPTPPPVASDTSICIGVVAPLLNVYGDSLKWYATPTDAVAIDEQPLIATSAKGEILLYVSQTQRCGESERKEIKLTIKDKPEVIGISDTMVCKDAFIELRAAFDDAERYLWSAGDTECCIIVGHGGYYSVAGINICGATEDTVYVEDRDCSRECIWLPSAFSPNNDGRNDLFRANERCAINGFRIMVFNRWGQKIYESKDIKQGWDGTYGGKLAEPGSYSYIAEAYVDQIENVSIKIKGAFVLIR